MDSNQTGDVALAGKIAAKSEVLAWERAEQTMRNIGTKVRIIYERILRREGWGVCTGDLERYFVMRELDVRGGFAAQPLPDVVRRAFNHCKRQGSGA